MAKIVGCRAYLYIGTSKIHDNSLKNEKKNTRTITWNHLICMG